jgi:hypothetical protein
MRSRNNHSSIAYSNDGYKNKSHLHNKFKKGSTVMDLSAEDSVDMMLKRQAGLKTGKRSSVSKL